MEFRVFLTGGEPSERSAALIRGLSDLRVISGGYAVLKLEAVDGGSVPGLVSPQEAAAAVLPGAAFKGCEYSRDAFLGEFAGALEESRRRDMGYLDPILGDELADAGLTASLEALLSEDIPVMGTIAARSAAPDKAEYDRILAALERDEGTLLLDIADASVEEINAALRVWAETVLDWAHHKKFDPQMKLRARRRRTGLPG